MPDLTAKRTLVKSPPELWEELSEVEGLTKHFGAFGEIKITKLEPEHTVAWEGEHASGTVSIEPSGWGTKVTLHAELPEGEADPEPDPEAAAEPEAAMEPEAADSEPDAAAEEPVAEEPEAVAEEPAPEPRTESPEAPRKRRGLFAWLFKTRTGEPEIEPEPVAVAEPEPVAEEPEPVAEEPEPVAEEPEPVAEEPEAVADADAADEGDRPDSERARAILDEALDALGAAHHRPFSRA